MIIRCGPLFDGDTRSGAGFCGATFDDEKRLTVCPHNPIVGGVDPLPGSEDRRRLWLTNRHMPDPYPERTP